MFNYVLIKIQVLFFLKYHRHIADLVIETTVKINAMPILSSIVGCNPNKGKINNCINMAKIKPLPTSMILSIISFFII